MFQRIAVHIQELDAARRGGGGGGGGGRSEKP